MNLSFLDKTSHVTPLLVKLYDSRKLYDLATDEKPSARAELTSAVCELFETELSEKESELIADVLIGLMRQAELGLRQALAQRLASLEKVPFRLILQMANDEIDVAEIVLRKSPVLSDLDISYIIKSKGPEYWRAIARRQHMSDQVMNLLADTRDIDTAIALVENHNITLNDYTLNALGALAQTSDALAGPLVRRDEMTAAIARTLLKHVGQEVKELIKVKYGIQDGSIVDTVDEVIVELVEATEAVNEFVPTDAMLKAAERYQEKGLLTMQQMLGTLRRGQVQAFIAQFSRFTGIQSETILGILSQPSGQGLAVLCKAMGILKEDFVSIFLLTNRVRNQERMVDLADMNKAINYFNSIKPEVARGIIQNSTEETLPQ